MASRHICPVCGGHRFITVAHVVQEWEVDELGNFESVTEDCLEVVSDPDDGNTWTCTNCGAKAIIQNRTDTCSQDKFPNLCPKQFASC